MISFRIGLSVRVENSTEQLFSDAAICSSENSLAGSTTIGDHYARSDSRDTSKFPCKTLDCTGARGKFKLDKFVNYCSQEGLSALYAAHRHGTKYARACACVHVCAHVLKFKMRVTRVTDVSMALVQMCRHIKGSRLQSWKANDYATFTFIRRIY